MPRFNVTISVRDGTATHRLRRAYVEHIGAGIPIPGSRLYITDDDGEVRDPEGNLGIDAWPNLSGGIDIRVICHNSAVRIPNGPLDHFVDFAIRDGARKTINRDTSPGSHGQFRVLNRFAQAYDRTFRQFPVFSDAFPLGSLSTLDRTRRRNQRIEVFYPTISPTLPFVEPRSLHTGYPIIHLKDVRGRLFGTANADADLIPAELSHALHFSKLTDTHRHRISVDYPTWIIKDLITGGDAYHDLRKDTDPLVAYLEAFEHFATRLDRFARANPALQGVALRTAFVEDELRPRSPRVSDFGTLNGQLATGVFTPHSDFVSSGARSATSIEGSIYAALFLDFARRPGVGMRSVVNMYIQSKALSFGQFRNWVQREQPQLLAPLEAVRQTWGL